MDETTRLVLSVLFSVAIGWKAYELTHPAAAIMPKHEIEKRKYEITCQMYELYVEEQHRMNYVPLVFLDWLELHLKAGAEYEYRLCEKFYREAGGE